jgi:hypothetical protein
MALYTPRTCGPKTGPERELMSAMHFSQMAHNQVIDQENIEYKTRLEEICCFGRFSRPPGNVAAAQSPFSTILPPLQTGNRLRAL